ncbi:MAG: LPS export ABC transporter permease LptF [Gammaproteobacteria bacterium]|nr:LPS export ABC transporter permease LptF [Gammaproteobacteria bacterium]
MIIYKYLARQLFASTASVAFVLSLILISGRFIKYMAEAATGRILGEVLFSIMAYRLPGFLELILPLSLFLGILLAYGQLYINNEMTVLTACGVGQRQVLSVTVIPTLCLSLLVAFLSLYLAPLGNYHVEQILHEQKSRSEFETLTPGRFHSSGGETVVYARTLSQDKTQMEKLFIFQGEKVKVEAGQQVVTQILLTAESGVRRVDASTGVQYLELREGVRYEGTPGRADYNKTAFESYRYLLAAGADPIAVHKLKSLSTETLWKSDQLKERAELQWRISMPLLVIIIALLGVPLSKVDPRHGRFLKLIPSIMIYLVYVFLLISSQKWIEKGEIDPNIGLWWVHLAFLVVAVLLLLWEQHKYKWRQLWVRGDRHENS